MADVYDKKRMLNNTLFLYGRMVITLILHLYTTRLVLHNLGVEDLGTYAVVGSVVSSMTFIGGSIGNSVQRFITYELGCKNGNVNNVFNSCLNSILFIVLLFVVLLETIGLWILGTKLNIPEETRSSVMLAYQFCIFSFIVDLINVPYDSVIGAHEKMNVLAGVTVLKTFLICIVSYFLAFVSNRLFVYSFGLMIISVGIRVIYQIYCRRKFPQETRYCKKIDKNVVVEISKYIAVSSLSLMLNTAAIQGVTWTVNILSGVGLNAIFNIASQLKNTMLSFSMNINRAISPQIIKTYANGMMREHKNLVNVGMRLNAFMMLLILFPFIFYADTFMQLWLKDVPEYTVFFVQLIAFSAFFDCLMQSIGSAVFATGRIKAFLLVTRTFYLLVLPLMYFTYKYTLSPKSLICSVVLMDLIAMVIQMIIVVKQKIVDLRDGIVIPMMRIGCVSILSAIICAFLRAVLPHDVTGLILLCLIHTVTILPIMIIIGATSGEKVKIRQKITSSHIFHRFTQMRSRK